MTLYATDEVVAAAQRLYDRDPRDRRLSDRDEAAARFVATCKSVLDVMRTDTAPRS